jgi:hypothetical protein
MNKLYYNPNQENKLNELLKISNPKKVIENAHKYLGIDAVYISTHKNKKYSIINPKTNKFTHFGSFLPPMEDFTFHSNLQRRDNYLKRAMNIRGNWRNDKYSPNYLSINLL